MELGDGGGVFDWFFLAMAHWKLGNQEEARRWYDKAVEWTDEHGPGDEELRRFRAEAAELLGVTDAPPEETEPDEKSAEDTDDEAETGDRRPEKVEPEPPETPDP